MWTMVFWRDAGERALRTAAQSALGVLGVDGLGLVDAPWLATGSVAGLAAVVSVLMSIVAAGKGDATASFLSADSGRHAG